MIKRTKTASALAALLLFSAAGGYLRAQTAPAVLNEVPDNAQVVVVISNLKSLATKISNAATRMNLPVPQDIIGTITRNVGVKEGLDQAGSAAFVVMPASAADAGGDEKPAPEMVMVLPATDAKLMLAPFKPTDPVKGVSEVSLPNDATQKGYVGIAGKYVVFGEQAEYVQHFLVKKAALGAALSPEATASFAANDVVIYANVPAVEKAYAKTVTDTQSMITSLLDLRAMADDSPAAAAQAAAQKEVVGMLFGAAQQYLSDASSALVTFRLSDAGLTVGGASNFKPDSVFGKFAAAQKTAPAISLKGLTTGGQPILAAGAFSWDSPSVASLVSTFIDKLISNPAFATPKDGEPKPGVAAARKAMELQKQLLAITSGGAFVMTVPPEGGKNGWVHGSMLANTTDAAKCIALQTEYLKASATDGGLSPEIKTVIVIDEKGVTIKGMHFNKITVNAVARDEANPGPGIKEAAGMIKMIYGPEGIVMYSGAVGKQVLTVFGTDAKYLEAAVDAAEKQSLDVAAAPEITAGQDQLVKSPNVVAYLPVSRWVKLAKPAEGGDAPAPAAVADVPMVISAGAGTSSATVEMFVPMSTLSALGELFKKFQTSPMGPEMP